MTKKSLILIFSLFSNLWIWKLISDNFLIAFLTILATFLLWLSFNKNANKYLKYLIMVFLIMLFLQIKTTIINDLIFPKLNGFGINFFKQFILNFYDTTFNKIKLNFSEVIDLNLYFFSNFPRGRFWYQEFEKFPYGLLPLFLIGIFQIKKDKIVLFLTALAPVILLGVIGNNNPLGPFTLFPLVAMLIYLGTLKVLENKKLIIPFLLFYIFSLIQSIAYAKSII